MNDGWWHQVKSGVSHAVLKTLILYIVAILLGTIVTWQNGGTTLVSFALAMLDPLAASLLLFAAFLATPSLLGSPQIQFPQNLTLPVVFVALVGLVAFLESSGAAGLQSVQRSVPFDLIWLDRNVLGILALMEAIVLTVWVVGTRSRDTATVN